MPAYDARVGRPWTPNKKTVELQPQAQPPKPSRIRRDPVPVHHPGAEKKIHWRTSEREIWLALIGILAFAIAIDIILLAISAYWN